jgi:diacylglycerol kinase
VDNGLVSPISLWWEAIPYALGGFSELFINVPGMLYSSLLVTSFNGVLILLVAYGIAYSRAPINMRGLVSAINLFNTGFAYIVNLAVSAAIIDPHLVWDFAAPAILGAIVTVAFVCLTQLSHVLESFC